MAREAFLKIAMDTDKLAQVGEENVVLELGLRDEQVSPGLMRSYVEQRMPLGDFRQTTQFAYMMAAAWEAGYRSGNRQLQGWAVKALAYVEQSVIDGGRTQMGWLLTGLAEPNYQLVAKNKSRPSVRPYTRLVAASRVAANISYLRDLDYMEQPKSEAKNDGEDKAAPKKNPRKKKGAQAAASGETTTPST